MLQMFLLSFPYTFQGTDYKTLMVLNTEDMI